MAGDSDCEGFYDDPFQDASDGDESCGDTSVEEEEDDDSDGEGMCEVPCCFGDDVDDEEDSDYDGDGDDYDDDGGSEEVCDEDEYGEEFTDDPCDEDDEEGDGEAEDLCEDPSSSDGEEGEEDYDEFIDDPCDEDGEEGDGEAEDLCEGTSDDDGEEGEPEADGSRISDSVQDESEEEEDDPWGGVGVTPVALPARSTPLPWTVQLIMDAVHTDSDDDSDYDSDSDDTDYDDDDYELQSLPASHAVVESLPEATLSEEEAACGCSVCKDVFESGQRVVRLPCKHYFHGDCIRPWLSIKSTCPVCRYQLPTEDAESRQRQARELTVLL